MATQKKKKETAKLLGTGMARKAAKAGMSRKKKMDEYLNQASGTKKKTTKRK